MEERDLLLREWTWSAALLSMLSNDDEQSDLPLLFRNTPGLHRRYKRLVASHAVDASRRLGTRQCNVKL